MIKNIKWLLIASVSLVACNDEEPVVAVEAPATAGSANFTKFVSLGNSLTAGFSDNALFKKGQQNAYPAIMAQQFKAVGGGEFKIPFTGDDNLGGLKFFGTPIQGTRLYLAGFANATTPNIIPVPGAPVTEVSTILTGGFNNMGVPGAKSFHLLAPNYGNLAGVPTGAANPYFARFASAPGTTILADAVAQAPTFFSLWIGNNDVLSYATSGGIGVNQLTNPNPATYGPNDITNTATFANVIGSIVDGMTATGAKGVVGNIPYVTSIPFFTTVPANALTTFTEAQTTQLNGSLYGPLDAILTALGQPDRFVTVFPNDNNPATTKDANPLLIIDETLTNFSAQITGALIANNVPAPQANLMGSMFGRARHARSTVGDRDYVLLTTRGLIGTPQPGFPPGLNIRGVTYPLQDAAILTADETLQIKTAVDGFNIAIKTKADAKGLAFVDTNAVLAQVASPAGFRYGNFMVTSAFISGGAFSLDGVHPSARGQALIANKFLEAINAKYGATLKMVNIGNYQTQYPLSL